jgi:hypothetical protein
MTSNIHLKIDRILGIWLRRAISCLLFLILFGSGMAVFTQLDEKITDNSFTTASLWPEAMVPLGILIAFSGLMYNRARAVGTKTLKYRFRSLYAAESLLAAACFYLAAIVCAYFAASTSGFFIKLFKIQQTNAGGFRFILFGPTIVFGGWAILESWSTIRTITPNGAFRRMIRLARRVRKML